MNASTSRTSFFAAGLLSLLLLLTQAGCGKSDYMRPITEHTIARSNETATVVFIRPSNYGGGIVTTILDDKGHFMGDSMGSSYFAVQMPPGDHTFLSWGENTAVVRARLAPGKVYFIEVAPRMGAFSTRIQLLALTPRHENWPKIDEWLRESRPFAPDTPRGQSYLDSRKEDVAKRLQRANEIVKEYDAEQLAERTMGPEDGR